MNYVVLQKALCAASLATLLMAAGASSPRLSSYVGKYPSDRVSGVSLYRHPTFRAVVNGAAPNATVRNTVLAPGVETPIERQGALIVARMCEPHNCGDHQWTIAILNPRGPAAICYHDNALMGEQGRWFVSGRPIGHTRGCWEGEHTTVPDEVFTALAKTE